MNEMVQGADYLRRGFSLIFKPGMKRFMLIPLVINILIFMGLFFAMRYYMSEFTSWITVHLPAWLQWFGAILWVLFFISFFIFMLYTFIIIANLLAAPFNALLAEKVERYLTGTAPERSLWENIKDTPRIIGRQLSILGYYLPRALGILLLFFIPVVHFLVPMLWFLFSAWFLALTYLDYSYDNHRISLARMREELVANRWRTLSFGSSVLLVSMIPVLNFFVIPAAVAGAVSYFVDQH